MAELRTNFDEEKGRLFCGRDDLFKQFPSYLQDRGHGTRTQKDYVASAKHFQNWLITERKGRSEVNRETVQLFLEEHLHVCSCPQPVQRNLKMVRAALNQLLLMKGEPRIRPISNDASDCIEASIREFDCYLHKVCGLAESTRWYHRRHARAFLSWLFGDRPLIFSEIRPDALVRFVTERAEGQRPGSIGVLAYSLRTYMRFLAFNGRVSASLATTIPTPPNWSMASLPSTLESKELERFWAAFDQTSAIGKRDYAMARCLNDLGLRCCEVAAITLDAIDWRSGVLRLPKTKSHREEVLPLPEKTGHALVDYLREGRPAADARAIFVYHRAPKSHAVHSTTVRGAIRRAFARAGLPWTGPHILRHTIATRLLQNGASLKEIADVLRHESLDTTQIYTKVDLRQLSSVAMPWPGRLS